MKRLTLLALCLAPALAYAEPTPSGPPAPPITEAAPAPTPPPAPAGPVSFELKDRGDAVEVIAHNIKAARTAIAPIRSRLEVPIAPHGYAKPLAPIDPTVKVVEFDGGVLSVKLNFERPEVKALSRFAQAIQVGNDLHMIVPRTVPAEGAIVKLPEPTLPPEIEQAIAKAPAPRLIGPEAPRPSPAPIRPAAEPAKPAIAATAPAAAPAATPVATQAATPAAPPAATPAAPANALPTQTEPKPQTTLKTEPDDKWSNVSLYAAIGIAGAGLGLWMLKKKKANTQLGATIDVIAQRSLGGKARIVWLSAGQREMIVAVTAQQVRMLGQWRRTETGELRQTNSFAAVLPEAIASMETRAPRDRVTSQGFASPAVQGLLSLRARTQPVVNEDVATGDTEADQIWAREILAATGARR